MPNSEGVIIALLLGVWTSTPEYNCYEGPEHKSEYIDVKDTMVQEWIKLIVNDVQIEGATTTDG